MSGASTRFRKIRRWLQLNRVFFEVFGWVVIGVAGVTFAYQSAASAGVQARLMDWDHLPIITIHRRLSDDDSDRVFESDRLIVENDGYFLWSPEMFVATFIRVVRLDDADTLLIPLRDYYATQFLTGQPRGQIAILAGLRNNSRIAALWRRFMRLRPSTLPYSLPELMVAVRMSYNDYKGERHTRYFIGDPVYGNQYLSAQRGSMLFQRFTDSASTLGISVDSLGADSLLARLPVSRPTR